MNSAAKKVKLPIWGQSSVAYRAENDCMGTLGLQRGFSCLFHPGNHRHNLSMRSRQAPLGTELAIRVGVVILVLMSLWARPEKVPSNDSLITSLRCNQLNLMTALQTFMHSAYTTQAAVERLERLR
jgi:hypothetical protein